MKMKTLDGMVANRGRSKGACAKKVGLATCTKAERRVRGTWWKTPPS